MSLNVILGLNAETLLALNALTEAIRSLSGFAAGGVSAPAAANVANTDAQGDPVYWRDPKTEDFGTCSEAEYKALKKANSNLMKIPQGKYDALVAAQAGGDDKPEEEEEPEETAAQKKTRLKAEADAKKKADADAKKKADAAKKSDDDDDVPSEQAIIDAFGAYLSPELDKAERQARAGWVRPLVARFGVARATDIAEDDRKLALNLLQRKIAGQDVDATNDEYEEFEAEEPSLV